MDENLNAYHKYFVECYQRFLELICHFHIYKNLPVYISLILQGKSQKEEIDYHKHHPALIPYKIARHCQFFAFLKMKLLYCKISLFLYHLRKI
ncbi:MAG: hypothetical protein CMJ41_08625, partial [Phycisphaerae bacterium]|nr:hypothetical protein [Phycisphaerae bacterium]